MLGKRASKLMRHYNLHIEKNLQQRTHLAPIYDVGLYPWHILEEALQWFIASGRGVQRLTGGGQASSSAVQPPA
jgi:Leu/Phe-tRNA-protein transferase